MDGGGPPDAWMNFVCGGLAASLHLILTIFLDMIDNAEKKAQTPFENIRTPRPWEIDTDEHKRKYMKAAHLEVESKIDRREAEKDQEEARIKAEIEAIRRKNAQKSLNASAAE